MEGTIPVADGTVLQITVYRQNGTEENWTLTVQTDTAAEARAVIRQIDSLPDAADLTLEDADAVKTARTAFEALSEEEKSQVTNIDRLEELEARLAELETAKAAMQEKDETIQDLRKEIVDWESAASQSEYDAAAAQKRIDELEEENTTLATDNETLAGEKDTLTAEKQTLEVSLQEKTEAAAALQAELESVQGKYTSAKAKADFMDSYVVFVNNDGTGLYHRYDCGNFLKSNFWAYSRKLAQNNGYTACPVCGG